MVGFILSVVLGSLAVIIVIAMTNSLIIKRNRVRNAFAGINTQLKKRCDLVPNLVAAVREYMEQERGVLEKLTALYSRAQTPKLPMEEKLQLDHQLSVVMRRVMIQAENYPRLKTSADMELLRHSLKETEEQIAASRRAYNTTAANYNNAVEMFPSKLVALLLGYQPRPLFSTPESERENADVEALFEHGRRT